MPLPPSTTNPAFQADIDKAIEAIPSAHCATLGIDEIFSLPEAAYLRMQDWAFTQRFALCTESKSTDRQRWHCVCYHSKTRNTRGTLEEDY